jgi:hypothetical protein
VYIRKGKLRVIQLSSSSQFLVRTANYISQSMVVHQWHMAVVSVLFICSSVPLFLCSSVPYHTFYNTCMYHVWLVKNQLISTCRARPRPRLIHPMSDNRSFLQGLLSAQRGDARWIQSGARRVLDAGIARGGLRAELRNWSTMVSTNPHGTAQA